MRAVDQVPVDVESQVAFQGGHYRVNLLTVDLLWDSLTLVVMGVGVGG